MKNLKIFETEADVQMFVQPNVVLIADTGEIRYNVPLLKGVFIQHVNGSLHTEESWTNGGFSNGEANGVAVISDNARFVIAKSERAYTPWQNTATLIEGIPALTDKESAITDFNGFENTELMTNSVAKSFCSGYVFANGTTGYLGAAGEWNEVLKNFSAVTSAMASIGGTAFNGKKYWTSTQESQSKAWICTAITETLYAEKKTYGTSTEVARPFGKL